jgi:hypothetical protein
MQQEQTDRDLLTKKKTFFATTQRHKSNSLCRPRKVITPRYVHSFCSRRVIVLSGNALLHTTKLRLVLQGLKTSRHLAFEIDRFLLASNGW